MASRRSGHRRAVAATAAWGATLVIAGAVIPSAARMGWWATTVAALLLATLVVGSRCRSALRATLPDPIGPADPDGGEPVPLRPLLDQVPVPLIRVDGGGAHAINRAARTLFGTDDRILPPPPALLDESTDRLRHEGRRWRVNAVETAPGQRLAVLIDVEAEERAADGRANDEMMAILGHELLNGLSPVVSLADSAVTAEARGDPMLAGILATLARRVEGLESFTRGYRALSRLPDPVRTPVPLPDLAGDLAKLFASRFGPSVALAIDVPPALTASVDREQLTQALWALLQNGADAALGCAPPREVRLTITATDRLLTLRVADTGPGVAAPDRARIFRPFYSTKPEGSGVGLSLARRIARAHGGDLVLLATSETTFAMQLVVPETLG